MRQKVVTKNLKKPFWKFYKEKLDAEYALAVVDEGFVGNEISRFTGSVASDKLYDASNQPITDDYEIREFGSDNVFMAKDISGFYSGSISFFIIFS